MGHVHGVLPKAPRCVGTAKRKGKCIATPRNIATHGDLCVVCACTCSEGVQCTLTPHRWCYDCGSTAHDVCNEECQCNMLGKCQCGCNCAERGGCDYRCACTAYG